MTVHLADCSEQDILKAFLPVLQDHNQRAQELSSALLKGPGDDAAVLDLSHGLTVITTDTQTENQDFRLVRANGAVTSGYDIGWKATTQNLADVASMGASPISMVVSLSLPAHAPLDFVTDFARGMTEACTRMDAKECTISGGDLGRSQEISVTVTALGLTQSPVYRSGANVGDIVAIAGDLGTSAAGFALLESELPYHSLPEDALACVNAQLRPLAPLQAGLAVAGIATSMMDISDGPLRDAERIASASTISIDFFRSALEPWVQPLLSVAELISDNPKEAALRWVLTGGENHGLLATFSRVEDIPASFVPVGSCRAYDEDQKVTVDQQTYAGKGWDHFE